MSLGKMKRYGSCLTVFMMSLEVVAVVVAGRLRDALCPNRHGQPLYTLTCPATLIASDIIHYIAGGYILEDRSLGISYKLLRPVLWYPGYTIY